MTPEEINRIIAEKCMGWHEFAYHPTSLQSPTAIHNWLNSEDHVVMRVKDFDPYHNFSHAMMALDKFPYWEVGKDEEGYYCMITLPDESTVPGGNQNTKEAAISLAIVEAVKGE